MKAYQNKLIGLTNNIARQNGIGQAPKVWLAKG